MTRVMLTLTPAVSLGWWHNCSLLFSSILIVMVVWWMVDAYYKIWSCWKVLGNNRCPWTYGLCAHDSRIWYMYVVSCLGFMFVSWCFTLSINQSSIWLILKLWDVLTADILVLGWETGDFCYLLQSWPIHHCSPSMEQMNANFRLMSHNA